MMLGVVTAMRADDAPPPFHDNRPYTGDFPDDAVIKMPFPWSINVRCSSMEGSFVFLIGDHTAINVPLTTIHVALTCQ